MKIKCTLRGSTDSDTVSSAVNDTKESRHAGVFTLSFPACFLVTIFGPCFSWWKWNSRAQLVLVHRTQTNCPKCTSLLSQNSISSWSHSYSSPTDIWKEWWFDLSHNVGIDKIRPDKTTGVATSFQLHALDYCLGFRSVSMVTDPSFKLQRNDCQSF